MFLYNNSLTSLNGASGVTNVTLENNVNKNVSKVLTSRLFKGDPLLQSVANGYTTINVGRNNLGPFLEKIQTALMIVIPEIDGLSRNDIKDLQITKRCDKATFESIKLYQFWTDQASLPPDGDIGSETILALDRELNKINYYDIVKRKTIHNESKSAKVGKFTVVWHGGENGNAPLREEPLLTATIIKSIGSNKRVRMIDILPMGDWVYVEVDDPVQKDEKKRFGYLDITHIWTKSEIPEPNARLYTVKNNGEGLLDVAGKYSPMNGVDRRYYANVLLYVNNPEGVDQKKEKRINPTTGKFEEFGILKPNTIYLTNGGSSWYNYFKIFTLTTPLPLLPPIISLAERTWEEWESQINQKAGTGWNDWSQTGLRHSQQMWLPSQRFADSLKDVVNVGAVPGVGDLVTRIKAKAASVYQSFVGVINDNWPVGWGINIDSGAGATFGIPIGVDKEHYMYLWRSSVDEFTLIRRGVIGGGFDSGFGAGFFVGSGKPFKKNTQNNEEFGIGGVAGAEVKAGVKLTVHEEFVFPFKEDLALASMLSAALELDKSGDVGGSIVSSFSPSMLAASFISNFVSFNIDPTEYMKKCSVEFGGYLEGHAGASAGITIGDENWKDYWTNNTTSKNTQQKAQSWTVTSILSFLRAALTLSASVEIAGGIEIEIPNGFEYDELTGYKVPNGTIKVDLYAEGSLAADLNSNSKIISLFLPVNFAFSPEFGGGIKFSFEYEYKAAHFLPNTNVSALDDFKYKSTSIYKKAGSLDIFDGPAFKTEIKITPYTSEPFSIQTVLNSFDSITIEKRLMIGATFGRGYKGLTTFYNKLPILITGNGKPKFGVSYEGYFTIKVTVNKNSISTLINAILTDIKNGGKDFGELLFFIIDYIQTGKPPQKLPQTIYAIYNQLTLMEAKLNFSVAIGAAVGAQISVGLKARFQANLKGALTIEKDIKEQVVNFFQPGNKDHIVKSLFSIPQDPSNKYYTAPDPGTDIKSDWNKKQRI